MPLGVYLCPPGLRDHEGNEEYSEYHGVYNDDHLDCVTLDLDCVRDLGYDHLGEYLRVDLYCQHWDAYDLGKTDNCFRENKIRVGKFVYNLLVLRLGRKDVDWPDEYDTRKWNGHLDGCE